MGCTPSTLQQQQQQPKEQHQQQQQQQQQTVKGKEGLQSQPVNTPATPSSVMKTPLARITGGGGGGGSPRSWRFKKASDKEKNSANAQPPTSTTTTAATTNPASRPTNLQRTTAETRRCLTDKFHQPHESLKVLLVFGKNDATAVALRSAAVQLGYECSLARNLDSCVDAFQSRCHDMVIVDNRDPKTLDGEAIGRALRNIKSCQYSVLVAVVKRAETEKHDSSVIPYINAGYDRWMVETPSLGPCLSELLQMETAEVQPRKQLWCYHSFLLMAERSRELIIVTDTSHHIVYANRAVERAVGTTVRDLYGRLVYDLVDVDSRERLLNAALKGRDWEGLATVSPRRNSETLMLACRVMPNGTSGRMPANLVFVLEPPGKRGSEAGMSGRGSVPSVRRGSADIRSVCSDGLRRQSVTKLNALSIEAPITKVVTLISQAQEQSSPEVALMLDKVVDILRTTELYSPVVREDKLRPDDPVTTDLISALLQSQGGQRGSVSRHSSAERPSIIALRPSLTKRPSLSLRLPSSARPSMSEATSTTGLPTTRRSSNDSAVARGLQAPRMSRAAPAHSKQLNALLDTSLMWEFDLFKLEELSGRRPLTYLGMNLMDHFEVQQTLNVDSATIHNWLSIIEMNYRPTNTYHNSTHAADVMQASSSFLERERLQRILDPLDAACCLIAAAVHDIDHPGKSSAFLCNSDHELAILYNDICVLESHHAALAFKLTVSDERVNIFKGLDRDVYKTVRSSVIDMVLATEMTKHFEHLAKFVNVFSKPMRDDDDPQLGPDIDTAPMTQENIALAKRMLIKCADVSNPARPLPQCVEWAMRIAEEYFLQTDEEKEKQLPVVMPMFDRSTCSIPKSQIGFMDFIINDMFEAWEAFLDMPQILFYIDSNYGYWQDLKVLGRVRPDGIRMIEFLTSTGWIQKFQFYIPRNSLYHEDSAKIYFHPIKQGPLSSGSEARRVPEPVINAQIMKASKTKLQDKAKPQTKTQITEAHHTSSSHATASSKSQVHAELPAEQGAKKHVLISTQKSSDKFQRIDKDNNESRLQSKFVDSVKVATEILRRESIGKGRRQSDSILKKSTPQPGVGSVAESDLAKKKSSDQIRELLTFSKKNETSVKEEKPILGEKKNLSIQPIPNTGKKKDIIAGEHKHIQSILDTRKERDFISGKQNSTIIPSLPLPEKGKAVMSVEKNTTHTVKQSTMLPKTASNTDKQKDVVTEEKNNIRLPDKGKSSHSLGNKTVVSTTDSGQKKSVNVIESKYTTTPISENKRSVSLVASSAKSENETGSRSSTHVTAPEKNVIVNKETHPPSIGTKHVEQYSREPHTEALAKSESSLTERKSYRSLAIDNPESQPTKFPMRETKLSQYAMDKIHQVEDAQKVPVMEKKPWQSRNRSKNSFEEFKSHPSLVAATLSNIQKATSIATSPRSSILSRSTPLGSTYKSARGSLEFSRPSAANAPQPTAFHIRRESTMSTRRVSKIFPSTETSSSSANAPPHSGTDQRNHVSRTQGNPSALPSFRSASASFGQIDDFHKSSTTPRNSLYSNTTLSVIPNSTRFSFHSPRRTTAHTMGSVKEETKSTVNSRPSTVGTPRTGKRSTRTSAPIEPRITSDTSSVDLTLPKIRGKKL